MAGLDRPPVYRISLWQIAILALLSTACYGLDKTKLAALVAGALVQIVPNGYFALLAFRFRGARASTQIVQAFYRGEVGKFVMTLVGFASVFIWLMKTQPPETTGMQGLAVFVGYLSMLAVQWWAAPGAIKR